MRFLIDTNLPPVVAEQLVSQGYDAIHTSSVGLASAKDGEIWRYAGATRLCIVTKDEDFVLLRAANPAGPSVVWVRIGNAVRRVIRLRLAEAWPEVVGKLHAGEGVVEIR